jgi:hypothetical protein
MLKPQEFNLKAYPRKIKIANWTAWAHHRSGWKYVLGGLQQLHHGNGVLLHPFLDEVLHHKHMKVPWVGFLHNTPYFPKKPPKNNNPRSLQDLVKTEKWKLNMRSCRGIFTVSQYIKSFLDRHVDVPISALTHPIEIPEIKFSFDKFIANPNKLLLMTGNWMRRFVSFYILNSGGFKKQFLKCQYPNVNHIVKELGEYCVSLASPQVFAGQVFIHPYVNNNEYDLLHRENIVFLDLYDVGACNTILDCIVRNTPLLVRKLCGAVEYLGVDYPFYYETLPEAEEKLQDFDLILATHKYLVNLDKTDFQLNTFIKKMTESEVYNNLPLCN